MVKKILVIVAILAVIIQFFRIDKENPPYEASSDFISVENAPEDIQIILKQACYDCHSHQTTYPWYSNVAPVSWWLKDHIDEGREHLNFSVWASYDAERREHKLEELAEEVEEGEMPLDSYTWTHAESRLSDEQRQKLVDWANSIR